MPSPCSCIVTCAGKWLFSFEFQGCGEMTYVQIKDANVEIPIYDSHALRLIRLPSFARARVGTSTVSQSGNVVMMHALKDLSLELSEGDRVCVIGHNGAGKTTLLRLVAGIYPAAGGVIKVGGNVFAL